MVREFEETGDTVEPVKKARLLAVVAALFLVAVACGNSGAPTSWEDNPADYRGEPDVGQAERNFRTGCEQAAEESPDERARQDPVGVCKCSFDKVREELTFEELNQLDDDLKGDINHRSDQTNLISQKFRECLQ